MVYLFIKCVYVREGNYLNFDAVQNFATKVARSAISLSFVSIWNEVVHFGAGYPVHATNH